MKKMLLVSTFEAFDSKLDDLFGKELSDKKVICIPTAAYAEEGYESWLPAEMSAIQKRVGSFVEFDITGKSYNEVDEVTRDADIIYVTGGNTYHLMEQVQACNLKKCIEDCFERGGTYFGCSAGGVIASPRIDFMEDMDENKTKLNNFTGLNFIDFLFMPHIDHKHYGPIILKILDKLKIGKEKILALKDDQGLFIENSYVRII